jgi:hypothetical protein
MASFLTCYDCSKSVAILPILSFYSWEIMLIEDASLLNVYFTYSHTKCTTQIPFSCFVEIMNAAS